MTHRLALCAYVVAILLAPWPLLSSPQKHPARPAPAPISCGDLASLSLNSSSARQGSLLLAQLILRKPAKSAAAKWGTADLSFWPTQPATPPSGKSPTWITLVAIDLEKPPGDYPLDVTVQPAQGAPASCQLSIHVADGKFPTEKLKVAPQFVEPNPEQLDRAKKEQQRLREIYATVTPEKLWHGLFRIPLDGVTTGANFGRRRVLNGQPSSPHGGVDLPAPSGTPVHATQAGHVVLAEPLYFAGNTVVVDHGPEIYTLYAHLSEISVKVGDQLAPGQLLGKVGATGRVTGPHLHWGLSVHGSRVNALQLVKLPPL